MASVLIIADHTTGKLIQKYLMREHYSVDQYNESGFAEFPRHRYDVVIVDASRCPQDLDAYFGMLSGLTECQSFVLLRSMEYELPEAPAGNAAVAYHVSMSTKPIKLCHLAQIVRQEIDNVAAV